MNIEMFIKKYKPCNEAMAWLLTQPDLQSAWDKCTRSDWMTWALEKAKISEQQNAKLAAEFVFQTPLSDGRMVADLLTDQRSIDFLQLKKVWGDAEPGAPLPAQWEAVWASSMGSRGHSNKRSSRGSSMGSMGSKSSSRGSRSSRSSSKRSSKRSSKKAARKQQCDIIRSVFPVCPF